MVYGWFHPGGDWNHNARHDQIRSIVEQGRLDIDDYLLYLLEPRADGSLTYRRLPLVTGSPSEADLAPRLPRLNTLDISIADGHYYPNKAPGVTLLSVPGYGLIYAIMRLLGLDPDDWWVLTLGSHFTTLLFVSLVSALGGPIFYAAVTGLFPEASERVRICAALTYGLGTLVMAYSTHLVDHGPVAALGLLSFHWARSASMPMMAPWRSLMLKGA